MSGDLASALAPFARRPEASVVIVDYDGTTAPIVEDPQRAVPSPATRAALGRLIGNVATVAVLSGRPVAFLREALVLDGLALVGQYGLERLEGAAVVTDARVQGWEGAVDMATREAEAALPGLVVERKGRVAATLHWRQTPDLEDEALTLARRLADVHRLNLQPGRLAVELRPPVAMDKGIAVQDLAAGAEAVLMAGDDHGDVAAFLAIGRLLGAGRLGHGLRVAVRSPEVPAELVAHSDCQVDGPAGLAVLLHALADVIGAP